MIWASVINTIHGVDCIFHKAAIEECVKKIICLSTVKAGFSVNMMGQAKRRWSGCGCRDRQKIMNSKSILTIKAIRKEFIGRDGAACEQTKTDDDSGDTSGNYPAGSHNQEM